MQIEVSFPVGGESIPTDHGYGLYAALSHIVPDLHASTCKIRIAPIRGVYAGSGLLQVDSRSSRLQLRLAPEDIPTILRLAGTALTLGSRRLRLGVPEVRAIMPVPHLIARMVAIKASSPRSDPADKHSRDRTRTKRYLDPVMFREAVCDELTRKGIRGQADLPVHEAGPRSGEPYRRVLRVHGKAIVGFSVRVQGLTGEESIRLQEEGLGGRKKMGCGFFVPMREGER
jgi:Cas6 Crispr